jgi:hypothetical protein
MRDLRASSLLPQLGSTFLVLTSTVTRIPVMGDAEARSSLQFWGISMPKSRMRRESAGSALPSGDPGGVDAGMAPSFVQHQFDESTVLQSGMGASPDSSSGQGTACGIAADQRGCAQARVPQDPPREPPGEGTSTEPGIRGHRQRTRLPWVHFVQSRRTSSGDTLARRSPSLLVQSTCRVAAVEGARCAAAARSSCPRRCTLPFVCLLARATRSVSGVLGRQHAHCPCLVDAEIRRRRPGRESAAPTVRE